MKNIYSLLCILFLATGINAQNTENITFLHQGKTVFGNFSTPDNAESFCTVIINAGTGANDRDGTLPMVGANVVCLYPGLLNETLKPYKQLSDALVEAGYAVLTYDKLEYTYPGTQLGAITFEKLWLPVNSAIDYVKTRSDVDTTSIILIGHSEGSTIIPYLAKNRNDVKALVSIAGPRSPLDSLLAYQIVHITETCDGSVPDAQAQANQILEYFEMVRAGTWNSTTPHFGGVSPGVWSEYIQMADSVSINYNLANLPTLFTGLGDDLNVPLTELSRLQNEVTITDDFWTIPNLNHFMTTATNPNVSPVLTDTIIYWLDQQCMTTGINSPAGVGFSFEVFPNPFSNDFRIMGNVLEGHIMEVVVRNVVGQEIIRENLNASGDFKHRFSTSLWPKGVYLVSIISDTSTITKKVIKQ